MMPMPDPPDRYVPGCTHDIFVSYAHRDNIPPGTAAEGWVTVFARDLKQRVGKKLGSEVDLWIDHDLAQSVRLTPQILGAIRNTALLVVVVSPSYLNSEWCRREREAFLEIVAERTRSDLPLSLVEIERVDADPRRRQYFEDRVSTSFWVVVRSGDAPLTVGSPLPDTNDPDHRRYYYPRLNNLAADISKQLEKLKAAGGLRPLGRDASPAVFLAQVSAELNDEREQIRFFLEQARVRTLPDSHYPQDLGEVRPMIVRDLAQCKVFAQLLGASPETGAPGLAALQYECAREAAVPILQRRPSGLDLMAIPDVRHRQFLDGPHVREMGLEAFKNEITRTFMREGTASTSESDYKKLFVVVNAEISDQQTAAEVGTTVETLGAGYALPAWDSSPREFRRDLARWLRRCQGVILIHDGAPVVWVREQLDRVHSSRGTIKGIAVYEGRRRIGELNVQLPSPPPVSHLDCRNGTDAARIREFLDSLRVENRA